jgi:hypothetical protein
MAFIVVSTVLLNVQVMKEKDSIEAHIRQDEAELAQLAVTAQGLEREYLVKRRTLEMLPK